MRRTGRGIWTAPFLPALLLVVGYAWAAGDAMELVPAAPWLLLGVFAQGGIAEELVFRGYLFGHIRRTRPFWRAALISAIRFALVHFTLVLTLPWAIALTAVVMSVVMTFPLSWLYELGGRTIWAPAVLHTRAAGCPETDHARQRDVPDYLDGWRHDRRLVGVYCPAENDADVRD